MAAQAAHHLLGGAAEQHHGVGRRESGHRRKHKLALAWPQFHLDRAQWHAHRQHHTLQFGQHRFDLVVALLGQHLEAPVQQAGLTVQQADLGRRCRPARVGAGKTRIVDTKNVELDFQAGDVFETGLSQAVERARAYGARVVWHRTAVREKGVALHPRGFFHPGQQAKGRRVGHQHNVGGTVKITPAEGRAAAKNRPRRAAGGVLEQDGSHQSHAFAHRRHSRAANQRLAVRNAVLVGENKTHGLDAVLVDTRQHLARAPRLRVGPQAVLFDKAHNRVSSRPATQAALGALGATHGALARRRSARAFQ